MREIWPALLTVTVVVAVILVQGPFAAQQTRQTDGNFPAELEVATTVADGFTIAAVGDIILAYPQSGNPDPDFQRVLDLVRNADVACGRGQPVRRRTALGGPAPSDRADLRRPHGPPRSSACRVTRAAQRILTRLQGLSEPLGTTIEIKGNRGVIRVAP